MVQEEYLGRLLIVDDDVKACVFLNDFLSKTGFRVDHCHNLSDMRDLVKRYSIDAVILDIDLGEEDGLDGLPFLLSESPYTKVFIFTANTSLDVAINAMESGAAGYFTKETDPHEMEVKLKDSLKPLVIFEEDDIEKYSKIGMVGNSQSFKGLCTKIEQVKNVDSTVLILGESGTGKEVVARAIHRISQRSSKRFEAINCAAIPEALLESELFGHKKGAFTDAKNDRKGIFELCSEGTLLLDEIGDMPLALQAKLLRVLQEKKVVPLGGHESVPINTRVIAATHRDLMEEIHSGSFREDLYFRLSVVPLHIPPLRHRKDDIELLTHHFLEMFNKRFKKNVMPPGPEVLQRLLAYDWPGNIRELKNAIERAVVLDTDGKLGIEELFQHLTINIPSKKEKFDRDSDESRQTPSVSEKVFELPLTEAKQAFEKFYVERLLKKTGGNIAEVARRSGRYRADIYRLFDKYGIDHKSYR